MSVHLVATQRAGIRPYSTYATRRREIIVHAYGLRTDCVQGKGVSGRAYATKANASYNISVIICGWHAYAYIGKGVRSVCHAYRGVENLRIYAYVFHGRAAGGSVLDNKWWWEIRIDDSRLFTRLSAYSDKYEHVRPRLLESHRSIQNSL